MAISEKIRAEIIERSGYRCEYCRTNSRLVGMPLVMEHILPKGVGGKDESENLAFFSPASCPQHSCLFCKVN